MSQKWPTSDQFKLYLNYIDSLIGKYNLTPLKQRLTLLKTEFNKSVTGANLNKVIYEETVRQIKEQVKHLHTTANLSLRYST